MIAHQLTPHAAKRFLDGSNLGQYVRAVPVFLDHFLQPAHLALDSTQPFDISFLDGAVDGCRLPAVFTVRTTPA
jgi:hypothetical protein